MIDSYWEKIKLPVRSLYLGYQELRATVIYVLYPLCTEALYITFEYLTCRPLRCSFFDMAMNYNSK